MLYSEVLKYLESFINYEKITTYSYKDSLKLERIKDFLITIGNPQDNLKYIHVAGTKGKGSTCAMLAYILREAGFKTGLYTSPHLEDFRERIRILNPEDKRDDDFEGMIPKEELIRLVEELRPFIEEYNLRSKYGKLSFFEIWTAIAFVYFQKKKVDFCVLETGLGGRLDATNVVEPLVCVITPISYEHMQKLGNTLSEIAFEKAGIIKEKKIVISAPQEEEARVVIKNKAEEKKATLYEVGKDILFEGNNNDFNIISIFNKYSHLKIKLLGKHQLVNAAVSIAALECLRFYGFFIEADYIRKGLSNVCWPGRCEILRENPWIILDGAQNVASTKAIKETIKENFKYKKLILILGISKDKDIRGISQEFYNFADVVILTQADNPRATRPEILATYFKEKKSIITQGIKEALEEVKVIADSEDLVLITGSLFLVGEARKILKENNLQI